MRAPERRPRQPLPRPVRIRAAIVAAGLVSVFAVACATSSEAGPTNKPASPRGPAGTLGTNIAPSGTTSRPRLSLPPVTPATEATTTTIAVGTALPGGPIRVPFAFPPVSGPCTDGAGNVNRLTFQSHVLLINQPVQNYRVYTPKCYRWDSTVSYPVLYLMHGAQTDESQWDDVGVFREADRLIGTGAIPPMIIVAVDGIWAMGTYEYEPPLMDRFLISEVMPAVEQDFRVTNAPSARGIGGISRGGEWALILGRRHPELFGAIGGQSPAVGAPSTPNSFLMTLYKGNSGQSIWLDVGAGDSLLGSVTSFHQALDGAGIVHEFHTSPGGHDRTYWSSQLEAYLRFYARTWAPSTPPASSPSSPGATP